MMTRRNQPTAHNAIRQEASTLAPNSTSRDMVCPFCFGGTSKEKAFSVTRLPNAILYKCWRAACGLSGAIPIGRLAAVPEANLKKGTRSFFYDLEPLPAEWREFLVNGDMELTDEELKFNNIQYSKDLDRVIYPLFDYRNATVGYNARTYNKVVKPKTLVFWEEEVPKLHFPYRKIGEYDRYGVAVVEDQASSIKVARHMPCVSILGTHMGAAEATHLSRMYDGIVIFLDPGAEASAYRMARQYALLFNTVRVVRGHEKDPKNMTDLQLKEVLQL